MFPEKNQCNMTSIRLLGANLRQRSRQDKSEHNLCPRAFLSTANLCDRSAVTSDRASRLWRRMPRSASVDPHSAHAPTTTMQRTRGLFCANGQQPSSGRSLQTFQPLSLDGKLIICPKDLPKMTLWYNTWRQPTAAALWRMRHAREGGKAADKE